MPNQSSRLRSPVGVAVVGAGPYGLSVASHLKALGCEVRIFGHPMSTWRSFMPAGMVLKSEGFAMNISDPDGAFTFEAFCRDAGLPYWAIGWPVPVEAFAAYGEAFQKRFVPDLEPVEVLRIEQTNERRFLLHLASGETVLAERIVLATGIRPFARVAAALRALPPERLSHSADCGDLSTFAGKSVAVVGGGASAMDVAASLHRAGAAATVITRRPNVRFYAPGSFRSLRDRLLAPMTPLGPGWKKYLCTAFPDLFRLLPRSVRRSIVSRYLGPSPAWSVRDVIRDHVRILVDTEVTDAQPCGEGVTITAVDRAGLAQTLSVDHVIAATGYAIDFSRLTTLSDGLHAALADPDGAPFLSHAFESRVPGLHFVGTAAATSFGPMFRFVCGTEFAATRLSRHIAVEMGRAPIGWEARAGSSQLAEA